MLKGARGLLVAYVSLARLLWLSSPGWATLAAVAAALGAGVTVAMIPVVGQLVGAVADRMDGISGAVWPWFAGLAGLQIGAQVVGFIGTVSGARCSRQLVGRLVALLAEAGTTPSDLAVLEGQHGTALRSLDRSLVNWELTTSTSWMWQLLTVRLTGLGSLALVMAWRPVVGTVVAAAVILISLAFNVWQQRFTDLGLDDADELTRRSDYYRDLLVQPAAAKEVRLFGWAGWLADRYRRTWRVAADGRWQGAGRTLVPLALASLVSLLVTAAALLVLGADAASGVVALATVITVAQAILGLDAFGIVGDVQTYTTKLAMVVHRIAGARRDVGLRALSQDALSGTTVDPRSAGQGQNAAGISIHNLTFTYPTRDEPTLRELSLEIPAGQTVGLVGLNGAGKTTLINLVCGLREADSGQIEVGGVLVAGPQVGRVAAIFQDFQHYPLSLRDNVAFGAPDLLANGPDAQAVLVEALSKAGGDPVLERLGQDYEGDPWGRVLASEYRSGTELSGGQWQRVALARALAALATGSQVLILDEPTAALDVRAEAELFDRFADIAADVTTLLVSHRLSSVRRADRIVVLDGEAGQITEDGSHEELMAADGGYARLYRLQAERFAVAGGDGSDG